MPGWQLEQAALVVPVHVPAVRNWPAAQVLHAVQTRVAVLPYWSAAHVAAHVVPCRKVPTGQAVQLDDDAAVQVAQLASQARH